MKNNARKILSIVIGIIVVIIFVLIVTSLINSFTPFKTTEKATIDKHTFKINVASTDSQKQIGLSKTKNLPDGYGMLFPFGGEGFYPFWMRDMNFPIDIIYIDKNNIVKIFKNVPNPKSKTEVLKIYVSPTPADSVLEIKGGLSDEYNFKEGDSVSIEK